MPSKDCADVGTSALTSLFGVGLESLRALRSWADKFVPVLRRAHESSDPFTRVLALAEAVQELPLDLIL